MIWGVLQHSSRERCCSRPGVSAPAFDVILPVVVVDRRVGDVINILLAGRRDAERAAVRVQQRRWDDHLDVVVTQAVNDGHCCSNSAASMVRRGRQALTAQGLGRVPAILQSPPDVVADGLVVIVHIPEFQVAKIFRDPGLGDPVEGVRVHGDNTRPVASVPRPGVAAVCGVNARADLGPDSIALVGESACVVIPLGLGLCSERDQQSAYVGEY